MSSPCPPIGDENWPQEIADLRDGFAGALNVYRTMAHHPALLRAWAPLRRHVVMNNALGPVRSEIAILRTGVRLGSDYEWAHHVSRARALGMEMSRIAAVRGMPEGEDGVIVRGVDSLIDDSRLLPEQEAGLARLLGRPGVFDLIAIVGFYKTLACLLKTYDTPIDQKVAAEMAARPLTAT